MSASLVGSEMCIRDRGKKAFLKVSDPVAPSASGELGLPGSFLGRAKRRDCLLYTSDAADDM
eukprot:5587900-Alexandrium_andersonii.AAC.1